MTALIRSTRPARTIIGVQQARFGGHTVVGGVMEVGFWLTGVSFFVFNAGIKVALLD